MDGKVIFSTIQNILATHNFTVEKHSAIEQALLWHEQGMDFADALHLVCSLHADNFASFDRELIKKAISLNAGINLIEL